MTAQEQAWEAMEGVGQEIDAIRRTGPLITPEEALRLITAMRLAVPALQRAHERMLARRVKVLSFTGEGRTE
jgi:hypothetical protein